MLLYICNAGHGHTHTIDLDPPPSLRRLPLEMMLPLHRFPRRLRRQIEHVLPEIIQLRLIELCRQDSVSRELQILQRGAQAGDDRIRLDAPGHDLPQRRKAVLQLMRDTVVIQQITVLRLPVVLPDLLEHVGDIVSLDDAAGAPDLDDGGEVDAPFVLAVGDVDNVHALHEGGQARDVGGDAQVLEEAVALLGVGEVEFLGREGAIKGVFDAQALGAVRRGDADEVRGGEGGGGDVQPYGFRVGPDAGAFGAVDVLDDFVLHVAEDVVAALVFLLVDLRADVDEECTSLVAWSVIVILCAAGQRSARYQFAFRVPLREYVAYLVV